MELVEMLVNMQPAFQILLGAFVLLVVAVCLELVGMMR